MHLNLGETECEDTAPVAWSPTSSLERDLVRSRLREALPHTLINALFLFCL